jgi:hypothetical protein
MSGSKPVREAAAPEVAPRRERRPPRYDPSWPLTACYGPCDEVWRVSGFGTVLAARRRPDGREVVLLAELSLADGGVKYASLRADAEPGTSRRLRPTTRNLARYAPSVRLAPERVAAYLYGAFSLEAPRDFADWPERVVDGLSLLAPPPGDPPRWRRALIGAEGLTDPDLVEYLRGHPTPRGLPEGKEPLVVTTVELALPPGAGEAVAKALPTRRRTPKFLDLGPPTDAPDGHALVWVRPLKGGPPLAIDSSHQAAVLFVDPNNTEQMTYRVVFPGGQQGMGRMDVRGDRVTLVAVTLSRVSVLMGVLSAVASPLTLLGASWKPPRPDRRDDRRRRR